MSNGLEPPPVLGAPFIGQHPLSRRIAYGGVGIFMPVMAALQNALLSSNLGSIAGEAGLTTAEGEWLIVAFVAAAAFANLIVIKGRQQFGIMPILCMLLALNVTSGLLLIAAPSYATLMFNRATNGLMVSTSVAGGVYYLIQALPKARRVLAIALAIAALQLANALAAQFPVDMLTQGGNHGFACLATACGALQLLVALLCPLPPSRVEPVIAPLDGLSASLLCATSISLVSAITLGRTMWWTDTPWIGWLLAGAVVFGAAALVVETCRARPLLDLSWLSTRLLGRFVLIAVLERILLSEQTTGVIGLFSTHGLLNDQFHGLYLCVMLGIAAGMVVMVTTLSPRNIAVQCIVAVAAIGIAATLDSGANAESRPENMFLSQACLGFGTALFVGSALLYGIVLVLKSDTSHFMSTIFVFSLSQSLGSILGSALLGSLQYYYEQYALYGLADRIGQVAASRIALARDILGQQGSVLGYLNLFGFVRDLAIGLVCLLICVVAIDHGVARLRAGRQSAGHPSAGRSSGVRADRSAS